MVLLSVRHGHLHPGKTGGIPTSPQHSKGRGTPFAPSLLSLHIRFFKQKRRRELFLDAQRVSENKHPR